MRELKFRAWLDGIKAMEYSDKLSSFFRDYVDDDREQDRLVMQFTGLLDKNSKEIYEGDILKFHQLSIFSIKQGEIYDDAIAEVVWCDGGAGFTLHVVSGHLHSLEFTRGEIVGNIYDSKL